MKTKYEKHLIDWEKNPHHDISDAFHAHFTELETELEEWPYIADEANRLYGLTYGVDVEPGSPIDGLFSAVAATGYHLAARALARAFKVDPEILELIASESDVIDERGIQGLIDDAIAREKQFQSEIEPESRHHSTHHLTPATFHPAPRSR